MQVQILKIGIVGDIIGSMVGRLGSTSVQTFVHIPDLKIALTEYGGELFVIDEFTPHEKATVVEKHEMSDEMVALIQNWVTSQKAVKQFLATQAPFKEHFQTVRMPD